MDRVAPTLVVVAVLLGVVGLMWWSWRARSRRDARLPAGYPHPLTAPVELATARVLYVATTPRDRPLERLIINGLGFRARAVLTVTAAGVDLAVPGEEAVFIPAEAIELLTPATLAIDRVVETDGLLRLGWRLRGADAAASDTAAASNTAAASDGLTSVDSYFRIPENFDRDHITDAIRSIAADADGRAARNESEA